MMDILGASGVRRGSGSLGELHSPDEAEVKNGTLERYLQHAPALDYRRVDTKSESMDLDRVVANGKLVSSR